MVDETGKDLPLSRLRGLGSKSTRQLQEIGLIARADLQAVGAIAAFIELKERAQKRQRPLPSLNFLYAMAGALDDKDWRDIASNGKGRLLTELESLEVGFNEPG